MPGAPYYAQAFSPLPGRCFRMVPHHGEAGPVHCPEPVAWRGSWRAPNGRRYRIEACNGHQPTQIEDRGAVAQRTGVVPTGADPMTGPAELAP
jgi:hypothetical protein